MSSLLQPGKAWVKITLRKVQETIQPPCASQKPQPSPERDRRVDGVCLPQPIRPPVVHGLHEASSTLPCQKLSTLSVSVLSPASAGATTTNPESLWNSHPASPNPAALQSSQAWPPQLRLRPLLTPQGHTAEPGSPSPCGRPSLTCHGESGQRTSPAHPDGGQSRAGPNRPTLQGRKSGLFSAPILKSQDPQKGSRALVEQ